MKAGTRRNTLKVQASNRSTVNHREFTWYMARPIALSKRDMKYQSPATREGCAHQDEEAQGESTL
jgi:hypothetical protein